MMFAEFTIYQWQWIAWISGVCGIAAAIVGWFKPNGDDNLKEEIGRLRNMTKNLALKLADYKRSNGILENENTALGRELADKKKRLESIRINEEVRRQIEPRAFMPLPTSTKPPFMTIGGHKIEKPYFHGVSTRGSQSVTVDFDINGAHVTMTVTRFGPTPLLFDILHAATEAIEEQKATKPIKPIPSQAEKEAAEREWQRMWDYPSGSRIAVVAGVDLSVGDLIRPSAIGIAFKAPSHTGTAKAIVEGNAKHGMATVARIL